LKDGGKTAIIVGENIREAGKRMRPVWAEINLDAAAHNVREIRRIARPRAKVMAVVKADGYGHGANVIAETALRNGADRLAAATLDEALALNKALTGSPILIFGYTPLRDMAAVVEHGLIQTVYQTEQAGALSRAAVSLNKTAKIHLKIDTGMGRIGFLPGDGARRSIMEIAKLPHLELEGIFTHFAAADSADKRYQNRQLDVFLSFVELLRKDGLEFELRHAANSAAILDCPDAHLDLVRAGILIYGAYPSREVNRTLADLKPVMTWKAQVAQVKRVGKGVSISYGRTYTTAEPSLIATLPLGYADGYPRRLSNRSEVLIGGKRAPVVGTVCMDQLMVDVTRIPDARCGDEAVLIGNQGSEAISAEELAGWAETIPYETLCAVSARVPRVVVSGQ
jgi:alanine racemase